MNAGLNGETRMSAVALDTSDLTARLYEDADRLLEHLGNLGLSRDTSNPKPFYETARSSPLRTTQRVVVLAEFLRRQRATLPGVVEETGVGMPSSTRVSELKSLGLLRPTGEKVRTCRGGRAEVLECVMEPTVDVGRS